MLFQTDGKRHAMRLHVLPHHAASACREARWKLPSADDQLDGNP